MTTLLRTIHFAAFFAVCASVPAAAGGASASAASPVKKTVKIEVRSEPAEKLPASGTVVKFGEGIVVEAGETVDGSVVAFGGSIGVDGTVEGSAVAFGGSIRLGPEAVVKDAAVSIGGRTERAPGSRVGGAIVDTPGAKLLARAGAVGGSAVAALAAAWAGLYLIAKGSASLGWIVLGLVLIALFPKALAATKDLMGKKPLKSVLVGILAWPCLGVVTATLVLSLIGIPLIPLLFAAAAAAYVWGFAALAYLIGERLASGRWKSPIVSVIVGMVLLKALQWIPLVKWLVCVAVAAAGAGASILSGFGVKKA
ncbi:MAG: hypothetical protein ABII00_19190 [Elusimicrobiota bacterium]